MSFDIQPSPEIMTRDGFPLLCQWRNLKRVIEVGVDRAEFAQMFLESWGKFGEIYLGVDFYGPYGEMAWDRSGDLGVATIRFERFARVAKLAIGVSGTIATRISSLEGVNGLYGSKYDFVYIDGSHEKEAVRQDLANWWPIVSEKGILAGHDWDMMSGEHSGVREAVAEFAQEHDLTIYYTTKDDPRSWYVYKNGIPGSDWRRC